MERPDWPTCTKEKDCTGVRLWDGPCLAHAEPEKQDLAMAMLSAGANLDVTRGVTIDEELLSRILHAAPLDDGRPVLREADFSWATFCDGAVFRRATFGHRAVFRRATFGNRAIFGGATFGNRAIFEGTTFGNGAIFEGTTFGNGALFRRARFRDKADFEGATFGDEASFDRTQFGNVASFHRAQFGHRAGFGGTTFGYGAGFGGTTFGYGASFDRAQFGNVASFHRAQFGHRAYFTEAQFGDEAHFTEAQFGDEAHFTEAQFGNGAVFSGATFDNWALFGPLLVLGSLALEQTTFANRPSIEIAAGYVSCIGIRLPEGANTFRLRWAEVDFGETDFAKPTIVSWLPTTALGKWNGIPFSDIEQALFRLFTLFAYFFFATDAIDARQSRPRVVSLRRANVSNLVLTDVDLSACRFAGAHNLDKLRLEGDTTFAPVPTWRETGVTAWRWTRRETLFEEQEWRARPECENEKRAGWFPEFENEKRAGWYPLTCRCSWLEDTERLEPRKIASLYRALRKGREDAKDEPGAADFYYGEMEMRRLSRASPLPERLILTAYWFASGYGLRALRAFTLLAVLLAVSTLVIANGGFPPPPQPSVVRGTVTGGTVDLRVETSPTTSTTVAAHRPAVRQAPLYWEAFWVSLSAAVLHGPETKLTPKGERVTTVVRYLGPILVGLTLLAVRGRVKR
jgi:uncharacterized protein YjbI with pentapeptide repeats